LGKA